MFPTLVGFMGLNYFQSHGLMLRAQEANLKRLLTEVIAHRFLEI